ncbi:hypothetical protein ACKI14_48990, partial [Streptomyces turgidiscabies]|uniref:hypothetical protein n=1 Tax=Streptomyces turgidiscabies TaxID=85558 RepID=UPI0038F6D867
RRALLENSLGRLDEPSNRAPVTSRPRRWGREHTVLLAAATCGVATSTVYVLLMLTGVAPFDAVDIGDESPLSQSAGEMLAIAELAFLALV